MAITTLAGIIAAKRQQVSFVTTTSVGTTAINSRFNSAGEPTGTLAGTSTAAGVVPTNESTGYPRIEPFAGTNHGYIADIRAVGNGVIRLAIFDRLFVAGAYAFNASVTLAGQPSYASRVPNADYSGLELWLEQVTNTTGSQTVSVGYTNQNGTNSRSTGAVAVGTLSPNSCVQLPFQSGDDGIQQVNSVTGTVATAGTFNIMVLRRLAEVQVKQTSVHESVSVINGDLLQRVYGNSALYVISYNGSLGSGIYHVRADIVEG